MRSSREVLERIEAWLGSDPNVRAAVLGGSRALSGTEVDAHSDFDVACWVESVEPYRSDPSFPERFGDVLLVQRPEAMDDPPPVGDGRCVYLVRYADGHRLDLTFLPVERLEADAPESLSRVLLDRDGLLADLPPSSERDFLPGRPDAKAFADCCDEFWWVMPYVAKALRRERLIQAQALLEGPLRRQLVKMLRWWFGVRTDFQRSPGKGMHRLREVMDPAEWERLEATYAGADVDDMWSALSAMDEVFRGAAREVAAEFGFEVPDERGRKARGLIRRR